MKMFFTLFLSAFLTGFANLLPTNRTQTDVTPQVKKEFIDKYLAKHQKQILLFAEIPSSKKAVKVVNEKWPDETDCCYDILKNDNGKIIMIAALPTSESGDWSLSIKHYFDDEGHTIAYERQANSFALPNSGVAYETTIKYFDTGFKLTSNQYKLVDKKGKTLDKKQFAFELRVGGLDKKVYPDIDACLAAYHIKLN